MKDGHKIVTCIICKEQRWGTNDEPDATVCARQNCRNAAATRLAAAESAQKALRDLVLELNEHHTIRDLHIDVVSAVTAANRVLDAALLAQPAAASIPPCCCAEIESAGVVNPDCLRHGAMHTAAASKTGSG